jgi:hypothetical protein
MSFGASRYSDSPPRINMNIRLATRHQPRRPAVGSNMTTVSGDRCSEKIQERFATSRARSIPPNCRRPLHSRASAIR